ncbi:allantoinase AllB [Curtobacterium sp. MCSS17_008]|uniref:allantoinase AllB n=1 Tax=Curtobacterium sp. MCSS17_008 TaxID=2175647 RepID=UPI000DAA5AD7|nr:allantoinase AllB [Curtobacterium sp. MCSS17_008]PZF58783.1 allantoinase AllB [Curtobacterium sp. MCSS17_008]
MTAAAPADLVLRARQTWVDGVLRPAAVVVRDGAVDAVLPFDAEVAATVDRTVPDEHVLLPGLVDTHVHVNEPGRTEWEGFASATRAAALGGVTTIVDMPLNSIPATVDVDALAVKRASAAGRVAVDVGFWGGAVPANTGTLDALHDAGVFGFKCFTAPSGVDEFPHLEPAQLRAAIAEVADLDALLIVHAEDPDHLVPHQALGGRYADFLATRPGSAEQSAIARVVEGARETGARVHVLHLSDAGALPLLRAAKADGVRVTVETCPHYLAFEAGSIPDGATEYKCCPPIRDDANRDALWAGLLDGTIDCVVSDHSPSTADLKTDDWGLAWGGIAGLQVGFRAVWTEAVRRGIPLEVVLPWFTTGPASLVGLADRGRIVPGAVAHLAVFDPSVEDVVEVAALAHRNPVSAFAGLRTVGRVEETWLRGRLVATAVTGVAATEGALLSRTPDPQHARNERSGMVLNGTEAP